MRNMDMLIDERRRIARPFGAKLLKTARLSGRWVEAIQCLQDQDDEIGCN